MNFRAPSNGRGLQLGPAFFSFLVVALLLIGLVPREIACQLIKTGRCNGIDCAF